jgi:uncharacterized membrane protein (DUF485 family)
LEVLHEPAGSKGKEFATDYKMRLGAWMFLLYALVYAGFVVINVVSPLTMGNTVVLGLNLAVTYGIGLIVFALILALIYNRLCTKEEQRLRASHNASKEQ